MAVPVHVPIPAPSKPVAESSAEPDTARLCVFSAEGTCAEAPLTSEPPLPDAEPLTSEPPLADVAPLASEPDTYPAASYPDYPGHDYQDFPDTPDLFRPEP
ncbi:hypothetical protein [Streptomyces sp. DH24]|uniref:hypothetical protein n=1 Tax=Streptomyces sp. DH24 TaxID=3040123 RepID=UPI002442A5DB|nr:hypothetical protein [Streptomyces sp. DH24]MDG9716810.1 hypothetical protein [Streptomyces sp. DH24]